MVREGFTQKMRKKLHSWSNYSVCSEETLKGKKEGRGNLRFLNPLLWLFSFFQPVESSNEPKNVNEQMQLKIDWQQFSAIQRKTKLLKKLTFESELWGIEKKLKRLQGMMAMIIKVRFSRFSCNPLRFFLKEASRLLSLPPNIIQWCYCDGWPRLFTIQQRKPFEPNLFIVLCHIFGMRKRAAGSNKLFH